MTSSSCNGPQGADETIAFIIDIANRHHATRGQLATILHKAGVIAAKGASGAVGYASLLRSDWPRSKTNNVTVWHAKSARLNLVTAGNATMLARLIDRVRFAASKGETRSRHYVQDYRMFVKHLVATLPLDEAMALAVGSSDFDTVGIIELGILKRHGLQAGHSVIDLGCGSGRLAKQLGLAFPKLRYHGIDVVPELLSYAATKSPQHFRFSLNENIAIPSPDDSVDFVTAFSVFTHLFHEESYCYLLDAKRAIKPGGKIIFSFLESSNHWPTFEHVLSVIGHRGPLTMFMERSQIEVWAEHLGLNLVFGDSCDLGQSVAVLSKPAIVI